jgi:hypothetical protein
MSWVFESQNYWWTTKRRAVELSDHGEDSFLEMISKQADLFIETQNKIRANATAWHEEYCDCTDPTCELQFIVGFHLKFQEVAAKKLKEARNKEIDKAWKSHLN